MSHTWRDLEGMMSSEISLTEKQKHCRMSLILESKKKTNEQTKQNAEVFKRASTKALSQEWAWAVLGAVKRAVLLVKKVSKREGCKRGGNIT